MPSEITFSPTGIVIVDAVPEGELQTAKTLEQRLKDLPLEIIANRTISRTTCKSVDDFILCLRAVAADCDNRSARPIIHLEGHGSDREFQFPDGTSILWTLVFEEFRKINIACGNHLLVTSGACNSARPYSSYDIAPFHRPAPVFGLLAPPNEITAGQAIDSFGAFYSTLFISGSFNQAIQATVEASSGYLFALMFCPFMFAQAAALYLREACMGRGRYERQEALVSHAMAERLLPPRRTRKIIRTELKKPQAPYLARLHDTFMHVKTHPENRARFSFNAVNFEKLIRSGAEYSVEPDDYSGLSALEALKRLRNSRRLPK